MVEVGRANNWGSSGSCLRWPHNGLSETLKKWPFQTMKA